MRNANHGSFSNKLAASIACAAVLWSPAGFGAGESGSRPGDANMTCGQIAAELQPYMNQMMPSVTALGQTNQELMERNKPRLQEAQAEVAAEAAASSAAMLDPTGLASKVMGQAQAKRQTEVWKRYEAEDRPLIDKTKTQTDEVLKQSQQIQSDARLQRLMQLGQEKNCQ
jgi:hypothetical protein